MGYANTSRPMGFRPYLLNGKAVGIVKPRPILAVRQASAGGNASFDLAVWDAYGIDANGNVFRAGPNDLVRGIVIGIRFAAVSSIMNANGPVSYDYLANGSAGTILGLEDNNVALVVQADTFAATNIGGKFNLADAAPDSLYSQSRQTINIGAGAGAQFQAQDIDQSPADNTYGANARVVVKMLQCFE